MLAIFGKCTALSNKVEFVYVVGSSYVQTKRSIPWTRTDPGSESKNDLPVCWGVKQLT